MGIRRMLRGAVESVLLQLPRKTRPGDGLILAYHNVVPDDWQPCGDRSLHLPLNKFEAQLRAIREHADIVPLLELLEQAAPNERRVAITFDDAYASAMELGVGACVGMKAPCTVFIAPGLLGSVPAWDALAAAGRWSDSDRHAFLWEQSGRGSNRAEPTNATADIGFSALRIATTDELLVVADSVGELLTFGSHTMSHANLGALGDEEARAEVHAASRWLQETLPLQRVPVVAYPYGIPPRNPATVVHPDDEQWGLLASGGWRRASNSDDPLTVARWNVPAGISLRGVRIRLRGYAAGG